MKHNIEFINCKRSSTIELQIKKTLRKIEEKFNWILSAEVFIKKEKNTAGKGKICEIKLNIPESQVFACSNEYTFELAIHKTKKELERQLKRKKELKFVY